MGQKHAIVYSIFFGVFLFVFSLLIGCSPPSSPVENTGPRLVATTTLLADLARQIGSGAIAVDCLMGPGVDPHLYQASTGDVQKIQNADFILHTGLHLEGKMGDIFTSLKQGGYQIICLEDGLNPASLLPSSPGSAMYDPHIWFSISLWKEGAAHLANQLSAADPDNAAVYQQNAAAYSKELDALDAYIRSRIEELPKTRRILITAHDAFRYFGAAYGFEIHGLQGIATDAEAATSTIIHLADFIVSNEMNAIFTETSVSPKAMEALKAAVEARGHVISIGGALYSDSLGDSSSGADTYIRTFRANIDTIIDALK